MIDLAANKADVHTEMSVHLDGDTRNPLVFVVPTTVMGLALAVSRALNEKVPLYWRG